MSLRQWPLHGNMGLSLACAHEVCAVRKRNSDVSITKSQPGAREADFPAWQTVSSVICTQLTQSCNQGFVN